MAKITVQNTPITIINIGEQDYISLTDMAAAKDGDSRAADVIKNWIRNRYTIEFLGTWEFIHNPHFPEDYTVETLMSKHISKARNPKIAHVFFLAGFIEAWGRGYEKIMREFDKANLKHPTFREEHGGVSAIIPREIFMAIRVGQGSMGVDDAKNDAKNIPERQSQILTLISQNPHISLDAIADVIGVSSPTIDREIAKMTNLVKRVGPKKGGYWEVIE